MPTTTNLSVLEAGRQARTENSLLTELRGKAQTDLSEEKERLNITSEVVKMNTARSQETGN